MVMQLEGRAAVIEALHLHGGRRVTKAAAWDLKRVTCRWKRERRGKPARRRTPTGRDGDEARRRLARGGDHGRRKG
jgi:hypothetical protein